MARITPNQLHNHAERISCGLFGTDRPSEIYCQRSATGWHVYRRFGAGAQALAECMTATEADRFLSGLSVGFVLTRSLAS